MIKLLLACFLSLACTPGAVRILAVSDFEKPMMGAKVIGFAAIFNHVPCAFSKVILTSEVKEAQTFSAATNDVGYFEFQGIPAGIYTVQVESCDFPTLKDSRIEVSDGETLAISIVSHTKNPLPQ